MGQQIAITSLRPAPFGTLPGLCRDEPNAHGPHKWRRLEKQLRGNVSTTLDLMSPFEPVIYIGLSKPMYELFSGIGCADQLSQKRLPFPTCLVPLNQST